MTRSTSLTLSMTKSFLRRYRAALDAALAAGRPEVVASVLGELAARAGLGAALGGRDEASLAPLLAHLARHVADPRHTRLLTGVAHRLLDAYGSVVRARFSLNQPRQRRLSTRA